MKRYALLAAATFLFACSASVLAAQAAPAGPQTPGPAQEHHTMPRPTNLQVLPKDISNEDLIKLMRGYAEGLGVRCTFCHATNEQTHHPDFASDAKPEKGIARTMIVMTREINEKYLAQVNVPDTSAEMKVVTCGTCHQGMSLPAPFVPKPETR